MEPPSIDLQSLQEELDRALARLATRAGKPLADAIRPVLQENLKRGRIQYHLSHTAGSTVSNYVEQVATNYKRCHAHLHQLQVEKSSEVWVPLLKKMECWAYSFLIKNNFVHSEETHQLAQDYSTDAAAVLVRAHFPYDTEFESWAVVLLQHTCRKQLRTAFRHREVPTVELPDDDDCADEWLSRLANSPDPVLKKDQYQDLEKAILDLIPEEQEVIELYYFEGLGPADIAVRLKKSLSQIYGLKCKALKKLRKYFSESGYDH